MMPISQMHVVHLDDQAFTLLLLSSFVSERTNLG